MKSNSQPAQPRNLQLDFFRGLALVIIFINHMPGNPWVAYTPSQLGPSDSAETFVFLSGFAAAIAFGRSFSQAGLGLGSLRVLFRCGQIYLAHIVLFLAMAAVLLLMNNLSFMQVHWQLDNLQYFFEHTEQAIPALIGLKYVPNFIDILPMYFVILLWLPLVWALSRPHPSLALAFSLTLYTAASVYGWELPADPLSDRHWDFNPFCWQLVFFTGFAFSRGWLTIPRPQRSLILLCLAFALFCYPLENRFGYEHLPWFAGLREDWKPLLSKGHLGFLRYLHFLAMAYLAYCFMHKRQHWLQSKAARSIVALGQQSLPIFMLGTCLSLIGGMLLDNFKMDFLESTWLNIAGIIIMLASAQLLNWLDQKPWKNLSVQASQAHDWPQQALLAGALLFISAVPMLLLQTTAPTAAAEITMASAPLADLVITPPDSPVLAIEAVVYQAPADALETSEPL